MCYQLIAVPSLITTLSCSMFLWNSLFIIYVAWIKLITSCLMILFLHLFRKSEFYFFNNLGLSNFTIYKEILAIDIIIAFVSFTLVLNL